MVSSDELSGCLLRPAAAPKALLAAILPGLGLSEELELALRRRGWDGGRLADLLRGRVGRLVDLLRCRFTGPLVDLLRCRGGGRLFDLLRCRVGRLVDLLRCRGGGRLVDLLLRLLEGRLYRRCRLSRRRRSP